MITMKRFGLIVLLVFLSACSSEPTSKNYVGTGNFDQIEAAKTRVSLGLTYLKNGNFSQAKFNLDKALEFDPRSGQANFAMAFYYQQVEEFARAEEYYQNAIGYSRNDPDVLNSYGAFLCKQGDYAKAKKYFLQAVDDKSYISTAETYENLAICAQSQGNDSEAIEYFNNALNHQPSRATSLLYVSELYVKQKNWDAAKKSLWKYERNSTVSADSLYLSYQIAQGQGDLRASLEYVDLLKRLHPDHRNTKQALSELGKFKPQSTVTQKPKLPIAPLIVTEPSVTTNTNVASSKSSIVLAPAEPPQSSLNETAPTEIIPVDPAPTETAPTETIPVDAAPTETAPTETIPVDAVSTAPVVINEPDTSITVVENEVKLTADEASQPVAEQQAAISTADPTNSKPSLTSDEAQALIEVPDGYHLILPKENLYRISLQYNVKMNKLLLWNGLDDASSIQKGSLLRVKAPEQDE